MGTASPPSITVTDDVDATEWATLVEADPRSTFFHRRTWGRLYGRHHGGEPRYLVARADGRLVGGIPFVRFSRGLFHFHESQPLGTYGGPLVDPTFPGAGSVAEELLGRFAGLGRHPLCVRVQCVIRRPDPITDARNFGPGEIHVLPLEEGFEHFWMKVLPRNRRTECNKAEREGVTVSMEQGASIHLDAFYPLHVAAHEKWQLRPHPRAFFDDVLATEPDDALFTTVHHEDALLGAHLSFVSGDELVAWHGTTSREESKRWNPAAMLVKHQAAHAIELGLTRINLGGSGGNQGIETFKRLLGGREERTAVLEARSIVDRVVRRLPRRAASPRGG